MEPHEQACKDLHQELTKLDKQLRELDNLGQNYTNTTAKLTETDLELNERHHTKLLQLYKEVRNSLLQADKIVGRSIQAVENVFNQSEGFRKRNGETIQVPVKKFKKAESAILTAGRQVAARTSKDRDLPQELWILCTVLKYIEDKQSYEVEDADPDEEEKFKRRYVIPASLIIPLPELFDRSKEFAKGTQILAMFPDTTSFYRAIVVQGPRGKMKPYEYTVKFEEDEDENGHTPTRKVLFQYVILRSAVAEPPSTS